MSLKLHLCARLTENVIQVEAARTIWDLLKGSKLAGDLEKDVFIYEDQGELRQDRYTLRTAPQFLGPQIEDIISALNTVTIECNSSTHRFIFTVIYLRPSNGVQPQIILSSTARLVKYIMEETFRPWR